MKQYGLTLTTLIDWGGADIPHLLLVSSPLTEDGNTTHTRVMPNDASHKHLFPLTLKLASTEIKRKEVNTLTLNKSSLISKYDH